MLLYAAPRQYDPSTTDSFMYIVDLHMSHISWTVSLRVFYIKNTIKCIPLRVSDY